MASCRLLLLQAILLGCLALVSPQNISPFPSCNDAYLEREETHQLIVSAANGSTK